MQQKRLDILKIQVELSGTHHIPSNFRQQEVQQKALHLCVQTKGNGFRRVALHAFFNSGKVSAHGVGTKVLLLSVKIQMQDLSLCR